MCEACAVPRPAPGVSRPRPRQLHSSPCAPAAQIPAVLRRSAIARGRARARARAAERLQRNMRMRLARRALFQRRLDRPRAVLRAWEGLRERAAGVLQR
jgi:hypothetical protein